MSYPVDSYGGPLAASQTPASGFLLDSGGGRLLDSSGGTLASAPPVAASYDPVAYDARATTFYVAEVDIYDGAAGAGVLRVSDMGYRTRASDPGGVRAYPGTLDTAFEIDRRVSLEPGTPSTATYGVIRVINLGQRYDDFTGDRNSDGRGVRVFLGQKTYDHTRGIYLDPSASTLAPLFYGLAGSWLLSEDALEVPLQDVSSLADKPLQTALYAGTGGLEGPAALTGKAKPITRGGTAVAPVVNVPLALVDTVSDIYQWTDGAGTVVALYEAGAPVFTYGGDVADLYAGYTPPGQYRTCNAKGVLQLGSKAVGQITADVTGAGPTTAVALAQYVLTVDLAVPAYALDGASFMTADASYPYAAGFYSGGGERGLDRVARLLGSVGGRLLSSRLGGLGVFVLGDGSHAPAASFTVSNTVSVAPIALPPSLNPPPARWRVAWATNNAVQTSGLNPTLTAQRAQILADPAQYAVWEGAGVRAVYIKPGDPAPVATDLLNADDANRLAASLGRAWQHKPDYYTVVVPVTVAAGLAIGSIVHLTWPLQKLKTGVTGQIVGEQIRSYDGTVTFEVLFNRRGSEFSNQFSRQFLRA